MVFATFRKRVLFFWVLSIFAFSVPSWSADPGECRERRQHASKAFSDGVLLLHSKTTTNDADDGYREEPGFYYLTGLENSPSAILAIDGESGDSWLFLDPKRSGDVRPGSEAERKLDIQHVADWRELDNFLTRRIATGAVIYYEPGPAMLPEVFSASEDRQMPAWVQVLQRKWPAGKFRSVDRKLEKLMAVESVSEQQASRVAALATAAAFAAGAKAVRPEISQREVELAVVETCWQSGARGVSFWPWAMAGANGVFPKPFESDTRYDHLDATLRAGDLMRLDVGCEWEHYQGDLGRTIPVSGRYTEEQREIWNIFVAAYQRVASRIKEGFTVDQAFEIWRSELRRRGEAARTSLAKEAVAKWSERRNVPYWQMHTMNLGVGYIEGPLRAGMVIDFEPIVSIGGQGYYLEDMYLVAKTGAELLTPGVPYSAEEIETFVTRKP